MTRACRVCPPARQLSNVNSRVTGRREIVPGLLSVKQGASLRSQLTGKESWLCEARVLYDGAACWLEYWAALFPMKLASFSSESHDCFRRNEGLGEMAELRENPPINVIVRHDPHISRVRDMRAKDLLWMSRDASSRPSDYRSATLPLSYEGRAHCFTSRGQAFWGNSEQCHSWLPGPHIQERQRKDTSLRVMPARTTGTLMKSPLRLGFGSILFPTLHDAEGWFVDGLLRAARRHPSGSLERLPWLTSRREQTSFQSSSSPILYPRGLVIRPAVCSLYREQPFMRKDAAGQEDSPCGNFNCLCCASPRFEPSNTWARSDANDQTTSLRCDIERHNGVGTSNKVENGKRKKTRGEKAMEENRCNHLLKLLSRSPAGSGIYTQGPFREPRAASLSVGTPTPKESRCSFISVYRLFTAKPTRVKQGMEQRRNEKSGGGGLGGWEIPEKTHRSAASSGTIPTCENPAVTPPPRQESEPSSPWWEAGSLTTTQQWPPHIVEEYTTHAGAIFQHIIICFVSTTSSSSTRPATLIMRDDPTSSAWGCDAGVTAARVTSDPLDSGRFSHFFSRPFVPALLRSLHMCLRPSCIRAEVLPAGGPIVQPARHVLQNTTTRSRRLSFSTAGHAAHSSIALNPLTPNSDNSRPGGLPSIFIASRRTIWKVQRTPRRAGITRAFFTYWPKTIRPESVARICNSIPVIASRRRLRYHITTPFPYLRPLRDARQRAPWPQGIIRHRRISQVVGPVEPNWIFPVPLVRAEWRSATGLESFLVELPSPGEAENFPLTSLSPANFPYSSRLRVSVRLPDQKFCSQHISGACPQKYYFLPALASRRCSILFGFRDLVVKSRPHLSTPNSTPPPLPHPSTMKFARAVSHGGRPFAKVHVHIASCPVG
ncbi:hypothetical protein PR048_022216 [Dryococelus australis]|uniref:Uncharacterized protein n=1 Tax=Dryococelus australis TaxID=614101 RepID=A0ABQ9H0M5_9NEOP|nr:hypothetical protein PR048_022216 [Dryococelus australis]